MDRRTVYPGQEVLEDDVLLTNRYALEGLARFGMGVMGSSTLLTGLACTVTTGQNVQIDHGAIYALAALDASAYATLQADSHQVLKQGLNRDPVAFAVPGGGGGTTFTVQAQLQVTDTDNTALPYFDAGNPAVPFTGQAGSGAAQPTRRADVCVLSLKAGSAADAGWTAVWLITSPAGGGAPTIAQHPSAPFIPDTLPRIPGGVQAQRYTAATNTGTVNALATAPKPLITALTGNMRLQVRALAPNTGPLTFTPNPGVLAAASVYRPNGVAISAGEVQAGSLLDLVCDGAAWLWLNAPAVAASDAEAKAGTKTDRFMNPLEAAAVDQQRSYTFGLASGTSNALVLTLTPGPTAYTLGMGIEFQVAIDNVGGGATVNVNGLGVVPLITHDNFTLSGGDLRAGRLVTAAFDGASFQLTSPRAGVPPVDFAVLLLGAAADG